MNAGVDGLIAMIPTDPMAVFDNVPSPPRFEEGVAGPARERSLSPLLFPENEPGPAKVRSPSPRAVVIRIQRRYSPEP